MKKFVINKLMNFIKKYNSFSQTKLDEIKYGLEVLYLTLTKVIVIVILSYFLNTTKELLLIFLFYGILRLFAFGMHVNKSWQCWVYSLILLLGSSYFSKIININGTLMLLLPIICILLIATYAPADTEKRPIINVKRRIFFKIISLVISLIYFAIILITTNKLYINILVFSLIMQTAMILPISYRVFKLRYNNYKYY